MKIINGNVFLNHGFTKCDLEFEKCIKGIGMLEHEESAIDAEGCFVVPGFFDIHTHGCSNHDFSDGNLDGLKIMSIYYAAHGVTSCLATTMTLSEPDLTKACMTINKYCSNLAEGAKCQGIHLEGPFLSKGKKGAHDENILHAPDIAMYRRLNAAGGNRVKEITVAPEEPGGMKFVKEVSRECTISLGHTVADYELLMSAFKAGADHVTHLYNGMLSLHHRAPGLICAALDSNAYVELICDGFHVQEPVIRATFKMFGDRVVLISDSLRCAGMPDGQFSLGGQNVTMKDGKATIAGTDTIAGSSITLIDAVRNCVRFGIPLEDAIFAATKAPAASVRIDNVGEIKVGNAADILILDKDLNIVKIFIDGKEFHS